MAVPPARAAVLDLLGLRSVRIERREPRAVAFGSGLALGDPVTLEQARRRFPVGVPRRSAAPDAVYLDEHPASGTRVDMVYRARPGLPRANSTGAGLLVTELRATVTPVIQKTIGSASKFERLTVGGDPAYFISGAEHGFAYVPTANAAAQSSRTSGWPGTRCSSSAATGCCCGSRAGSTATRRSGSPSRCASARRAAGGRRSRTRSRASA